MFGIFFKKNCSILLLWGPIKHLFCHDSSYFFFQVRPFAIMTSKLPFSVLRSNLMAKLPNRKWTHILANLWSIEMKLAVSAFSHALDKITFSFPGNYALLKCLVPSLLLAGIVGGQAGKLSRYPMCFLFGAKQWSCIGTHGVSTFSYDIMAVQPMLVVASFSESAVLLCVCGVAGVTAKCAEVKCV